MGKGKFKWKTRYVRSKRRHKRKMTVPIAPIVGLAAGVSDLIPTVMAGNYDEAIHIATLRYTGFNSRAGKFDPTNPNGLMKGLLPLIGGVLVHKYVGGNPIGLNRVLAQAGVPFIRI